MPLTAEQTERLAKVKTRDENPGKHSYVARRAYLAAWRERRRDHIAAQQRSKYQKTREHILNYTRNRKYGITDEWVSATYAAQQGACAICYREINTRSCHVDHDHTTLRVRGLLCARCNVLLGAVEDRVFLDAALSYVRRFAS